MQTYESENSEKISVIAAGCNISFSTAEIAEALATLASAFGVVVEFFENMKTGIIELFEIIKEFHEKEAEREYYRELHKLDFTRKKIVHQVMCRKPKHLVKKIIR